MWKMLKLAFSQVKDRKKPTVYRIANLGRLQQEILDPIAKGNYCLIEKNGLRAFCCFIMTNGLFTVVHAASEPGYMPELVRLIKKTVKTTGVEWYRAKNNKIHRSMRPRGTGEAV